MATITSQERTNITKLVVGMFNAAPGAAYLAEFTAAYQGLGNSLANLATALGNTGAFKALYPSYLTSAEFATKFLTTLGLQGNQEANDWVVAKVNGGTSYSSVILQAITAISNTNDAAFANAKALLNNKTTVAEYYSVTQGTSSDNLGVLQGSIGNVKFDSDVSTADAIKKLIGTGSSTGVKLTLGVDNLTSSQEGATFVAPTETNLLGAVVNTLSEGDTLIGTGTGNTLKADLALVAGVTNLPAPAISVTTQNIQKVELRAQAGNTDSVAVHGNNSHIDAERMSGVKEWWTVDSRASIQIEDVRTRPEDVTIGMRNTDPEVGFRVYFDPAQLQNNGTVKNSALTLTLDSVLTPGNLTEVPVDGVGFYLGGTLYQLKSDTIGKAANHTELLAALKAAAAAVPELKDVTFTLNANNTITLVDPAGKEFKVGGWQFVNNQVPPAGNIKFDQAVGEPVRGIELITTNVELDAVGRTSSGGSLDIGSLGDGGVEKFIVNVDRASWLQSMKSTDHLGKGNQVDGDIEDNQHNYLKEVYLNSKGVNGNLKVGNTVGTADGRLANGLTDVRVVDGSAFKGSLNLGINLQAGAGGSVGRYLDKSTTPVEFNYTGGQANDVLNVAVNAAVANHANFVMNINAGAGDDRVILQNGGRLNTTSVDGGTGTNTLVVNANVGMAANGSDSFKSFKNFQNYEVEGGNHNFTGLTGVQTVVVATKGEATTLRNLPVDLNTVTVTGKNQTYGAGNTNNTQLFAGLTLEAAKSETATVKLDNTALVNGRLHEASVNVVDQNATNLSAVRTLVIDSKGVAGASTANYVGAVTVHPVTGAVLTMATDAQLAGAPSIATQQTALNAAQTAYDAAVLGGNAAAIAAAQAALATAQTNLATAVAQSGAGINAEKVSTFNFTGDHAVGARINAAANTAGPAAGVTDLKVDASALTGKFDLAIATAVINAADTNKTVNIKGGTGTTDTLVLSGGLSTTAKTTVSGIETISFNGTGAGALGSKYDAVNTSGVNLYKSNGAELQVLNLKGVENVELGSFIAQTSSTGQSENLGNHQWFKTTAVSSSSVLNLGIKHAAGGTQEIATDGFKTLNLKLDVVANAGNTKAFVLDLSKVSVNVATGNVATALTLQQAVDLAKGGTLAGNVVTPNPGPYTAQQITDAGKVISNAVDKLVLTGGTGGVTGSPTGVDSANLGTLSASLKTIDVSGYKGAVTATIGDALTNGGAVGTTLVTTGNTSVKVGAYALTVQDASHDIAATGHVDTVTEFVFTTDAYKAAGAATAEAWTINGFQGINGGAGALSGQAGSLGNLTILDLSALGIKSLTDLNITTAGGNTTIKANNAALNFHIELIGLDNTTNKLGLENFKFAV